MNTSATPHSDTGDQRANLLLRELIDAGLALRAMLDCERATLKIGLADKQQGVKRWDVALENFREAR